jgi:hypothetical protein
VITRVASMVMLAGAIAWTTEIIRQALLADDGGPPMGALCMAMPAIFLLICGGAVWPKSPA